MQIKVKDLNLKDTITCGQIFRYEVLDDNSYLIIIKDRIIILKQVNDILFINSNNEENLLEIITDYLDLNRDYNELNKKILSMDTKDFIASSNGLKMIKQDPFETIIAYIISANNSVPSIRKSLNLIAKSYGEKVLYKDNEYYLFPTPEQLKNVSSDIYRSFKVGFRDKYIEGVVKEISDGKLSLDNIYNMNTSEALKLLMKYKGIGMKVASCILLFAYQRFDVFPIDTWVKKYMKDKYNIEGIKNIENFAKENYKEYSGLVIQYMFHYNRNISNK